VPDDERGERGRVALPCKRDQLLVRHTRYRPCRYRPGWVRHEHAATLPPRGGLGIWDLGFAEAYRITPRKLRPKGYGSPRPGLDAPLQHRHAFLQGSLRMLQRVELPLFVSSRATPSRISAMPCDCSSIRPSKWPTRSSRFAILPSSAYRRRSTGLKRSPQGQEGCQRETAGTPPSLR
jgi:hypothetical protein